MVSIDELRRMIEEQVAQGVAALEYGPLLEQAGVGRRQLDRRFRETTGLTPGELFRTLRAAEAQRLLADGVDVLNAAHQSGFSGPGRLHDAMARRTGMTPGELRRLGEGVTIRFGFFGTPLGVVLLGATERGLSVLSLCAWVGAEKALEEMHHDFPRATFVEEPSHVEPFALQLVAWLERRSPSFDPELDEFGTDFQRAVWAELRRVKPGETTTYGELARRLGRPEAVRAVARACATNRVSIAIPCHRAIASDGALRGYRWGLPAKEKLLEHEDALFSGHRDE
ncbi:methylated-DNA--[protein]-cysteine S-methyltransferase [bacterium]|nr:methylated-DNA--[protein]-cysteine S-methyltransferase [bacterium]